MENSLVSISKYNLIAITDQAYRMFLPSTIARNISVDLSEFREKLKDEEDTVYKAFWLGITLRESQLNQEFYGSSMFLDTQKAQTKIQMFNKHKGKITEELYI